MSSGVLKQSTDTWQGSHAKVELAIDSGGQGMGETLLVVLLNMCATQTCPTLGIAAASNPEDLSLERLKSEKPLL